MSAFAKSLRKLLYRFSNMHPVPEESILYRTPDGRTAAEHDCDRILYSDELRRLGGVTQVVAVGENPLFHNRLTHTLKVQQLARRIAEHLSRDKEQADKLEAIGGVDVAAAEAAGLAHDLGHPPFGRVGESVLNTHCEGHGLDRFEGNAQTFRILTKLALTSDPTKLGEGLGISRATLRAVIKYPWLRTGENERVKKWNAYSTESAIFNTVREGLQPQQRNLEAEIMDWADDITYAVHDLEDFIRAQHIPISALVVNAHERDDFINTSWTRVQDKVEKADCDTTIKAFTGRLLLAFGTIYGQRDLQFSTTLMNLCRMLISEYVSNTAVGDAGDLLFIYPNLRAEVELFKQFTWYYVIFDPRLASLQEGHKKIVSALFGHSGRPAHPQSRQMDCRGPAGGDGHQVYALAGSRPSVY